MRSSASVIALFPETGLARYRVGLIAAGLLALVIVSFVALRPVPAADLPPAAAAPPPVTQLQPSATLAPAGRGRSSASLAPAAVASRTAAPSEAPSAAPSAVAATTAPAVTRAPIAGVPGGGAGGVIGGVPGGAVGGVVGGAVGGTGTSTTPAPSPSPAVNVLPLTPPALAAGSDRFLFRVIDSRTGQPLSNVCVVPGTDSCGPERPHTNSLGYWWLDLPAPQAPNWSFRFLLDPDYLSATVARTYRMGMGTSTTTVLLRHR